MSKNWYIVTNTENLIHFIDYGLIIDEQGFTGTSYAVDAMRNVPEGYIPCFSADNIFSALENIKKEDKNLRCCLLELDFKKIGNFTTYGGLIKGSDSIYSQKQSCIHELEISENINCILLPAPLPFSCIKNIILQDDETKKNIQDAYGELFSVKNISFKKLLNLFKEPKNVEERPPELLNIEGKWQVEQRKIDYSKVFSYGGALGLLYYQTKNGRESTKIFNRFSGFVMGTPSNDDTLEAIKPFENYLLNTQISEDDISNIYKLIIDKIITTKDVGVARYSILGVLKQINIPNKYNSKRNGLVTRLEDIVERTIDVNPKDIFESIVNRAYADDVEFKIITLLITMFFLRDHVETMLKYYHSEFTETHYSLLAIFFGMSYGVVSIPGKVRKIDELSTWLSYKMAEYAHNIDEGNTVGFKEPAKPKLIYDDFMKIKTTKSYKLQNFYHWLSMDFYKREEGKEQDLVKWATPLEGNIEKGGSLTSYIRPQTAATIEVDILEKYIQKKIEEDTLFDSNEITLAYKKYTK